MSRHARNTWWSWKLAPERRGGSRGNGARRATSLARPLHVEPLEDRRLLANVTVGNLNDVVNGNTASIAALIATPGADGISLREAIQAANADAAADVIDFAPLVTGTIQLTNVGHAGEIAINNDLTINGPGVGVLTIRAFAGTATAGDGARIFNVDDSNAVTFKDVAISGLTLAGGDTNGAGGAIRGASENLTISACTLSGNAALSGGGVSMSGGHLTVSGSTISGNTVANRAGGIETLGGSLRVSASTITLNTVVAGAGFGGGVFTAQTEPTIDSSTISGNAALSGGGVVHSGGGSLMTITNSTISGNTARVNGGGVVALYSNVTIRHSTITANKADSDNDTTGDGGGVFVTPVNGNVTIDHTIVAGNLLQTVTRDDVSGPLTASFSLIGVDTGATITDSGGNQIGAAGTPIDPLLGPLADNGGSTMTHALLAGSPAIDAGDANFAPPPDFDQRGAPFTRVFDGNSNGVAWIDIGAFELQPDGGLGDYNRDGGVNAADYVMWRKLFGTSVAPPFVGADGDGNSTVDLGDYAVWTEHFGEALAGGGGAAVRGRETRTELPLERIAVSPILADASVSAFQARRQGNVHLTTASPERSDRRLWGEGSVREDAFGAWMGSYAWERSRRVASFDGDLVRRESSEAAQEAVSDDIDEAFELLSVGDI